MKMYLRFVLKIVFVCLYITSSDYFHCANLSEDIELIKCLSDIFCRVCKMRYILSVIHYTIRGAVCFQFTHFIVMIEKIYILCLIFNIKSEVWTITQCLGLGHETMVCAVCLFVFLQVIPFLITYMAQVVDILSDRRQLPILHSQYRVCWCPGDAKSITTMIFALMTRNDSVPAS